MSVLAKHGQQFKYQRASLNLATLTQFSIQHLQITNLAFTIAHQAAT
jgi:hypothetical protein